MNKTRLSFLAVATLAIGLFTGCTTTSTPLTPEQKAAQNERRARRITELATFDAGILSLREKNNTAANRAVLASITNELSGFLSQSNFTAGDISSYIASLPIKELKTVEGQMIAGGVITIVDEVVGDKIVVQGSILRPVIEAAIKGFGRAIDFAEKNPYTPPAPKPPKNPTNSAPRVALPPLPQRETAMEMMMPAAKAQTFSLMVNPMVQVSWQSTGTVVLLTSQDLTTWTELARTASSTMTFPATGKGFFQVFKETYTPTLQWDRNLETNVLGYRVYTGLVSRTYESVIDVGNMIQATVPISYRRTYFAVTAYDTEGLESDYSDEVWYQPGPLPIAIARL